MRSFSFAALLLAASPVAAQTPAAADPFAQAIAARQVADFARRQKNVDAMITAAQMMREIPFREEGGTADGFGAAALFAEAREMAGSNPRVRAQVDFAEKAAGSRGVVASAFGKGLVRSVQTVDPRAAYRFVVTASGGAPLRVGAIGDLGTSLAMRVQDGAGRTLCMDDNADYAPVCQLTPRTGGQYRIDILNKGAAKSRAVILSN